MRAPGRSEPAQRHRQPQQRPEQDIGEDQIVGRLRRDGAGVGAGGAHEGDRRGCAIEPRIGARGLDRDRVDVAGGDAGAQDFRRRDRQHARPGADVENLFIPPPARGRVASEASRVGVIASLFDPTPILAPP